MKRIFVLFAFILVASVAQAQTAQPAENPTERAHTKALGLKKQLGLSDEQTAKVEEIYLATQNDVAAIQNDVNKTKEQKDADIALVRKEKEKEIQALLTPEQLIKYNEIKANREKRRNASNQE